MKPQIIPADIAGKMVSWNNGNDVYYVGDVCPPMGQGTVYKDQKAFDEHVGICYVPEACFFDEVGIDENVSDEMLAWMRKNNEWLVACDNGYTRDDIYAAVCDAFDGACGYYDKAVEEYGKPLVEEFLDKVTKFTFDICDWQCPETFLNEFEFDEEWEMFIEEQTDDKRLTDKQKKEL